MWIYDRQKRKCIKENEYRAVTLKLLYNTKIGRIILKLVVARPYFSKIVALYKKSKLSVKDIKPFVQKYKIRTKEYDLSNINSFNDFFIRKRDIKDNSSSKDLVAIADAKLSIYNIDNSLKLNIKNSNYTLGEILNDNKLAEEYRNGVCLVYRLTVDDYHRYHFLDNGFIKNQYKIQGELHTIRPISSKYKAYSRNCREISILHTDTFGDVIQVEVGATLVGCINNHKRFMFRKLQEKGYFEYGGSTIIIIMKNNVNIDKDIEYYCKHDTEVKVRIGEKIGTYKYTELKKIGEK